MRIALGVEYDGHEFYGWQSQENLPTVQGHLEAALEKIADERVSVFCAGRTDAGVHATGQVVHFITTKERNLRAWVHGANSHLPSTIAVRWAQIVDDEFHARFSATARCYRYLIYNHSVRPAILSRRVTWQYEPLDAELMQLGGNYLIGEHDFTSFRSSQCESNTPMRNVMSLTVKRQGDFVVIDIEANAFLHHMVRNIAGALMKVGKKQFEPEWIKEILLAKDRKKAAETASAAGLYLARVRYPSRYVFPDSLSLF